MSWTDAGRWLLVAVLAYMLVGTSIHKARQFANAAPNQRTTAAQNVSIRHYGFPLYWSINEYNCSYDFSVNGTEYSGRDNCLPSTTSNLTIYFDPANPSLNSLQEFTAMSKRYYRQAIGGIVVGTLIIFGFVFAAVLRANGRRGRGGVEDGVVVDLSGTKIYPGKMGLRPEFLGQPQWDGNSGEPAVGVNGEAANAPAFGSSSRLRELYLEVANQIHPDRAANERDLALRERLMKEANAAFERGDAEMLRRVLEEYRSVIPAS